MLNSLNRQSQNKFVDAQVAKDIIDLIYKNTEVRIRKNNKITSFWKSIVLGQLPKVIDFARNDVDDTPVLDTKVLLDNIQSKLNQRK